MTLTRRRFRLSRFNIDPLDESELEAYSSFSNTIRQEAQPEDPPRSLESYRRNFEGWKVFDDVIFDLWLAREGNLVVGDCLSRITLREDNRHLVFVSISVLAPYRREGLGRCLLKQATAFALANDRTLMMGCTTDRVPSGAGFARRLGAEAGQLLHTNQLVLAELDCDLLENWCALGKSSAQEYRLGEWIGSYPEEELEGIAVLQETMNTEPRDDLQIEDEKITPEMLRQYEEYNARQGTERWSLHARHRVTGALVGYTEVFWHPETPQTLWQGDTAVVPSHRGHGLGKWLKATMLRKVQAERPQILRIRTGNADSNGAMLAINHRLGFKPYIAETVWQLGVDRVERFLAGEQGS